MQKEGIDYTKTFSPVVRITTIVVLMTISSKKGWHLHQLDMNIVIHHVDLHKEMCMKLALNFHIEIPHGVCRLLWP